MGGTRKDPGFSAVPTMIHDLLFGRPFDPQLLQSLVRPIVGGAGISEEVRLRYRERFGTDLQFSYGLTEAPTGVTQTDPYQLFIAGSSGRALPHLRVEVLDDEGRILGSVLEGRDMHWDEDGWLLGLCVYAGARLLERSRRHRKIAAWWLAAHRRSGLDRCGK
jgi:acyl-CoA synthetase (AMP-forming)/AMP-acid ligase II